MWYTILFENSCISLSWEFHSDSHQDGWTHFWVVHLSVYFERSMDTYILSGPWISIFLIGSGIPIFWLVNGYFYSYRSMKSYILTSTWIAIFWSVHGSLCYKPAGNRFIQYAEEYRPIRGGPWDSSKSQNIGINGQNIGLQGPAKI